MLHDHPLRTWMENFLELIFMNGECGEEFRKSLQS